MRFQTSCLVALVPNMLLLFMQVAAAAQGLARHELLLMSIFFYAGILLHLIARADATAGSKLSGINTRRQWFRVNSMAIVIRIFVLTCGLGYFLAHSEDWKVEPSWYIMGIFGLCFEWFLDQLTTRIPALSGQVPPLAGVVAIVPQQAILVDRKDLVEPAVEIGADKSKS